MAKSAQSGKAADSVSKWGPVPVAGVTLSARAIAEQHRTVEFIAECESRGFYLRASKEFMEFVEEFISRPTAKETVPAGAKPKAILMTASAEKFSTAAGRCDNTFKKKAP